MHVDGSESILTLKQQIEACSRIPVVQQQLTFMNKKMQNDKRLSDYNVQAYHVINLVTISNHNCNISDETMNSNLQTNFNINQKMNNNISAPSSVSKTTTTTTTNASASATATVTVNNNSSSSTASLPSKQVFHTVNYIIKQNTYNLRYFCILF